MTPRTPREARSLSEAFEGLDIGTISFVRERLDSMPVRRAAWNERVEESWFRTPPESLMARIDGEPAGRAARNEPELVINRATTLLACICLIRIQNPHWTDSTIADLLQRSFPEFTIHARDVNDLFYASCRNRSRWVEDMHHRNDLRQRTMGLNLLELLPTNVLAHLPQLPQERYRDRREGIRYLQELVGIEVEHRYQSYH